MEQKTSTSNTSNPPTQHNTDTNLPSTVSARPSHSHLEHHRAGGEMIHVLHGILTRVSLPLPLEHHSGTLALALFSFINGCISIGLMSALAVITHSPFIFPSLGPIAFLVFYVPTAPAASPRNIFIGHVIGVAAGYFSLVVTGLTMTGSAMAVGVTWPRVIAAALSLGLTAGLMILFKSPHAPAGATTLIVSLGILTQPWQLILLLGAVVLLILQATCINRLAGIQYPLWSPLHQSAEHGDRTRDTSTHK